MNIAHINIKLKISTMPKYGSDPDAHNYYSVTDGEPGIIIALCPGAVLVKNSDPLARGMSRG